MELVSFDTTNPPETSAAARWVARYLEDLGFEAEFVPHGESRTTLVAHLKEAVRVPPLAFNGHLDVVPAGAQEWKYPPFGGEISEGKVWGRGSSDMKGGIAAMLVAAKAVATSGLSLKGDLIFLATSGEELDMMGAKSLTSRKDLAKAQAIIIAEPTDNEVVLTERGVFWPEFTTYGKTAHGSTPELGHNAIKDMMTLLLELEKTEIPYEPHPVAGRFSMSINTINGGVKTNVVPDKCVATVDMRTVPGQDHKALLSQLDDVKRLGKNSQLQGLYKDHQRPAASRHVSRRTGGKALLGGRSKRSPWREGRQGAICHGGSRLRPIHGRAHHHIWPWRSEVSAPARRIRGDLQDDDIRPRLCRCSIGAPRVVFVFIGRFCDLF